MPSKLLLLLALLAYSVIASQSFMYLLTLEHVQLSLGGAGYVELRKLIDAGMHKGFKRWVSAAALSTLAVVLTHADDPLGLRFLAASIALMGLVVDALLAVKGSLPINAAINTWSPDHFPSDWAEYRARWFTVFRYRQVASLGGFASLLVAAVFG
jgi:hypothetical protein